MIDQSKRSHSENNSIKESSDSHNAPQYSPVNNPDEINLLEYIYVLVKNKWWIIGSALLGLAVGYFAAKIKGPTYIAEAVITAKENENKSSPNLSGLGAFSGLVASQLNIGGNPGLDKIDLILGSRKFNAELIAKYNLLPEVFKNQYPKAYKKLYDTTRNEWKKEFIKPNMLSIGAGLSGKFLKREATKNNTMSISIQSKDSIFSDTLLSKYLQYLNYFIQSSVLTDAKENVTYLDKQLLTVVDPLLREKLQGMIANELEKEMLVSKEAFKVIDPPLLSKVHKEKILYPIIFSFSSSCITFLIVILLHVFSSIKKTEENRIYIEKIKESALF
jgi:LPS O-antigen subunit length determinant protein (WzzB/FepE family)